MLTEGMYIADRYEILGKVGAGGMSEFYHIPAEPVFVL